MRRSLGRYNAPLFSMLPMAMSKISEILKLAQQRAIDSGLPYDGALTPVEAHDILKESGAAVLVDVRTQAELDWVGGVPGALHIEWQGYPAHAQNPDFIHQLREAVPDDALLLFMCRSGARSHAAAAAASAAGFGGCYNVLHGFEGDRDAHGHRNHLNGWRFSGLPWRQN